MKISDHQSMRLNNQLTVLRHIRDKGPISRVELRKGTRLSWGTITSLIKELLRRKVIVEVGAVTTQSGRRPIEIDMNTGRNFVLGLQLGSTLVRSTLVNVKGEVVDELDVPVNAFGTRREILACLIGTGKKLLDRRSVRPSRLAGVGVAAPGAVDFTTGVCLYAPHHPHWKNVPLRETCEREFGVPALVDHNINCFALSEKLFGLGRDHDDFLCVLIGTGAAAGIVIKGEVYRGAECFSGEFGHTCIDVHGPPCACGNNGCLETYVTSNALARMAKEGAARLSARRIIAIAGGKLEAVTGQTLLAAAREGDALAIEVFGRMAVYLGVGISNLVNLFNPSRVILGGWIANASEFYLPALIDTVEERAWHASRKEIVVSKLLRGGVMGATALILQEGFTSGRLAMHRA